MTSEIETLKTNEFLRRRKLRLQQVREQSKDIAKKLRIRAQVEKLRHIVELDEKKENEYLERQEQIVEQLEQVYARGKQNTGASHNLAFVEKSNVLTSVPATSTGSGVTKSDIAKLRAREAAAQLRQKKQEDLDKKNKLLQRKLKAREAANEISREKCKPASHSKEPSTQATEEQALKRHSPCEVQCDSINAHVESKGVETQRVVLEDKPVSALALGPETYTTPPCSSLKPDITQSGGGADASLTKTSTNRKNIYNVFHSRNRQEGGRDPNEKKTLAAQTRNDMGTQWDNEFIPNEWVPNIPKLKLPDDDKVSTVFIDVNAQKPRQTKPSDLFAVSEDMPSDLRSKKVYSPPPLSVQSKSSLTLVSEYLHQRKLRLREHGAPGPSKRHEHAAELQNCKQTIIWARSTHNEANTANPELKTIPIEIEKPQAKTDRRKKSNVTVYNHFTKDERLIEGDDSNLVLRDDTPEEDAYSIAMRESEALKDKLHHEKAKANRSRIASDKQTVEKEYQDTMAFLNSLAKTNNCRPITKAYMDEDRQQSFEERHQRKMQHAYRNIEKDAMRRQVSSKSPSKDTQGRRTKSPGKTIGGHPGDFQYSWMPVPESDASLFVHTIPTTTKDNVRFKNVDCYHEYRSRHKHTPPTRDKHFHNRARQEEPDSYVESEYYSSHDSRSSNNDYSIGEERQTKKSKKDSSDAERIIVYKILESKRKKDKNRKKTKFSGEHVRSVTSVRNALVKSRKVVKSRQGSLEHLNEGVYKNVAPKGENIQSLYFPASHDKNLSGDLSYVDVSKKSDQQQEKDIRQMQWDCGDKVPDERSTVPSSKQSQSSVGQMPPKISHLTFTKSSMSRGRTVSTVKETAPSNIETLTAGNMVRPDGGYVKLVGDKGQETEKFILGAAGLLNDDGYEVVIQLRKKDTGKKSEEQENKLKENPSQDLEGVEEVTSKLVRTVSSQSSLPYLEPALEDKTSTQSQPTRDVGPATPIQAKESDKVKENTEPMKQTVCTQTSLHSPSQRSLMIMSSSTSTAYMSPPEMILPACLKNNSETNTDKLGDSYLIKKQGKHVKCGCRKCTHVEPHVDAFDKKNMDNPCKSMSHVQVPPNTARSDVAVEVDEKPSRECTCPKCGYDKRIESKNNKRKNRRYLSSDKHNAVHKKTTASSKLYKEELNPIIKDYVKRLLTLNKEGLKAIEVLNQECSSVTTPGSSIINIESNVEDKRSAHAKLSLEYVKNVLLQKIYEEAKQSASKTHRKKKPAHKIKSLNISKHLLRKKSDSGSTSKPSEDARLPSSTSAKDNDSDKAHLETMVWNRSQKQADEKNMLEGKHSDASMSSISGSGVVLKQKKAKTHKHKTPSKRSPSLPLQNTNPSDASSSTDYKAKSCGCSATKTSVPHQREHSVDNNINCEVNFMSIAETKVQNMERIANLTEKCTQRLSNLAKVLEEVRKNKSSTFSHLSTGESSSESEQKTNKINVLKSFSQSHLPDNNLETKANLRRTAKSLPAKLFDNSVEGAKIPEISFDSTKSSNVEEKLESPKHYPSILEGIPKPGSQVSPILPKALSEINNNGDCLKRGKPPPALARMKHGPEDVIPHELSTVVEVDSPMSMKFKPQESVALENSEPVPQEPKDKALTESRADSLPNPDLLQSNVKLKRRSPKLDGSKMEMMDLNKFNEIMLKPFVSIEEFAKQCKVHELDEGSNIGNIPKDLMLNDDLSSMHSEGSLPDVIGELLKRNIITEPFKFDATSNIKSTTISSESSISVLALSKLNNKGKQKPYISIANREIAETSDTLSVSSNPDLENAFKKLGMGWASSTLKKTKERLALSSSSSSSSCSQKYMLKAFEKHESPTKKQQQNRNCVSVSTLKNAEQQTLQFKGITVQEFLTNELANKITFNNKSHREETEQEFISLHETKMPEEMKYSNVQERSGSADNSGANVNRARTSTPVQLFKSLTYHSSSSSNNNISNGLFSNIDDLSSVKVTSSSLRNHSTSDKDDLTIPNFSLKLKRNTSDFIISNWQDISLPHGFPSFPVLCLPYLATPRHRNQVVSPPGGEPSHAASPGPRSPGQNFFTPTTISNPSYVPHPLPLQLSNSSSYISNSGSSADLLIPDLITQ